MVRSIGIKVSIGEEWRSCLRLRWENGEPLSCEIRNILWIGRRTSSLFNNTVSTSLSRGSQAAWIPLPPLHCPSVSNRMDTTISVSLFHCLRVGGHIPILVKCVLYHLGLDQFLGWNPTVLETTACLFTEHAPYHALQASKRHRIA